MSRIDFYQLSRDPVEAIVPLLAAKACGTGARVLVVEGDDARRSALSEALWSYSGAFLAHGEAGEAHAERQPILLAGDCGAPGNAAGIAVLADGEWREAATRFERVLLLFGPDRTDDARTLWKRLGQSGTEGGGDGTSGHELHIFKQRPDGIWREGR